MSSQSRLDFNKGESLIHLASTYPLLSRVIEEIVQNALDSDASRIHILVDYKQRSITVVDNGTGVSIHKFETALTSVGSSIKVPGKLGQFGLGLISPLGKCACFYFTSCAAPFTEPYVRWTLDTDKIRAQAQNVVVPKNTVNGFEFNKRGTWWRTRVEIVNFTTDRSISEMTLDKLKTSILRKFSPTMLRLKTQIYIKFIPESGEDDEDKNSRRFKGNSYTGRPIDEITVNEKDVGNVVFRLYVTSKENRELPNNVVLRRNGDEYGVTFSNFSRACAQHRFSPSDEAMEALRSKIFEGEIVADRVELTKERTSFAQNDALVALSIAIDEWYKKQGRAYFDEEKSSSRDERYQRLGRKSLDALKQLVKSPEHKLLMDTIKSVFHKGTVGAGHVTKPVERTG